jgi:hypothetical protein
MTVSRTAALLSTLALASTAGLVATGPAAAAESDTVVINCLGASVVKPKQIVITCADAGVSVVKITWSSWTPNRATGTGTLAWNTCLPEDCASGIVEKYKARITLGRVASGPGVTAFSRMTLTFPQGGPAVAETATYTLDNAQS